MEEKIYMLQLNKVHHIAIICSDYFESKRFYTDVLGLEVIREIYRKDRDSYKLDLGLNGNYIIELFSFPHPPQRISQPEATGLRHLAFEVNDINSSIEYLKEQKVLTEPVRLDPTTGKAFTFLADPDGLPIELYQK